MTELEKLSERVSVLEGHVAALTTLISSLLAHTDMDMDLLKLAEEMAPVALQNIQKQSKVDPHPPA